jgi:hypothetical protein
MNSTTPNGREPPTPAVTQMPAPHVADQIAGAGPNPVHCTHSSAREKVLEHIFTGELLRALWRKGLHDVEILRPEVDRNGYEFIIGCNGLRRSIQLKTTRLGGKAQAVTINRRLADEPSGCVIWIFFDEDTLQLKPFLWLGKPSGESLQDLGDKIARHPRGNKDGIKPHRPGHRVVARSQFTRFETIDQVAEALFGKPAPAQAPILGLGSKVTRKSA